MLCIVCNDNQTIHQIFRKLFLKKRTLIFEVCYCFQNLCGPFHDIGNVSMPVTVEIRESGRRSWLPFSWKMTYLHELEFSSTGVSVKKGSKITTDAIVSEQQQWQTYFNRCPFHQFCSGLNNKHWLPVRGQRIMCRGLRSQEETNFLGVKVSICLTHDPKCFIAWQKHLLVRYIRLEPFSTTVCSICEFLIWKILKELWGGVCNLWLGSNIDPAVSRSGGWVQPRGQRPTPFL